jgi:hypothetical protein
MKANPKTKENMPGKSKMNDEANKSQMDMTGVLNTQNKNTNKPMFQTKD